MTRGLRRIAALLAAGFIVYKVTVAAFANKIPGQPFYGFGMRQWFVWILSPGELALVIAALLIEYGLLFFLTRRLSIFGLTIWAGLLGAYIASLLFPLICCRP